MPTPKTRDEKMKRIYKSRISGYEFEVLRETDQPAPRHFVKCGLLDDLVLLGNHSIGCPTVFGQAASVVADRIRKEKPDVIKQNSEQQTSNDNAFELDASTVHSVDSFDIAQIRLSIEQRLRLIEIAESSGLNGDIVEGYRFLAHLVSGIPSFKLVRRHHHWNSENVPDETVKC